MSQEHEHRGHGQAHQDQEQQQLSLAQLETVKRVLELPLVMSAWQLALQRYDQIKHYSPLVEQGLSKAEQTVQSAAEMSKPIVKKFERPLNFADSLACKGLDKFEEYVPAIKKSPEEIKSAGWEKVEQVKDYGNQKVDAVKQYSVESVNQALASQYVLAAMKYVDAAIDVTDQMVDRYLPANKEDEGESEMEKPGENADVVRRLSFVTDKMRHRMYVQALQAAQAAIARVHETTGQVLHHTQAPRQEQATS